MMWISVYQRKSAVKVFDFLRASASPWWILVFGCGYATLCLRGGFGFWYAPGTL
jgi:hypothetical protein